MHFDDDDNPFNVGSGLSEQESDYVGQISSYMGGFLDLDYRFQLENENLSSQRHEFDGTMIYDRLTFSLQYLYSNAIDGTDLDLSREQIRPYARFRFYDDWYVSGSMRYDLGENKGLRQASYGIDYQGQCMTFSVVGERNLTQEDTGDSSTEIMMRIGLKNLGEFESSGISVGGQGE